MPSEKAIEGLIRDLLRRERLANTIAADTAADLDELFERIADALFRGDPTAVARTRYRRARVDKVLRDIQRILRSAAPELEGRLKAHLAQIGRAEAKRAERALVATLGEVGARAVRLTPITQARLRAILNTDPFRGRILREHMRRLTANVYDRVLREIRLGMAAEESIQDIVRRVRGTQQGFIRRGPDGAFVAKGQRAVSVKPRFVGGVLGTTTRDAEALVRTAVTHVSNVGMLETIKANAEVVEGVEWVSTLDDRTSEICLALDGTVWELDDPDMQQPPAHFNCRSVLVPVIAWDRLGLEPPPEPDRIARDLSTVSDKDLRRKVSARRRTGDFGDVERVPSSTLANDWLKRQRAEVQDKMLGAGRARLFREGKITLKQLVTADNRIVPLSELASVN